MMDTFYLAAAGRSADGGAGPDGGSGLVHALSSAGPLVLAKPPIYVICPGRTYRTDELDATTPVFHQVEGRC